MSWVVVRNGFEIGRLRYLILVSLFVFTTAADSHADIIWNGDYSTGDFTQWHRDDSLDVTFSAIPAYGRPIQYGGQRSNHVGNGDLLSMVARTSRTVDGVTYAQGPTRGDSEYSARFTVKNSADGSEPIDCDTSECIRRRTELTVQQTLPRWYDALPYMSERWISVSHFVPSDWIDAGSGWGPLVFQVKPLIDGGGIGPALSIHIVDGSWEIDHRWTDVEHSRSSIPWQQIVNYSATFPNASGTDNGADLRADFPDQSISQAALGDLNKGGWTDWIFHIRFDARGSQSGGTGFLRVWKRSGNDDWIEVLDIRPRIITRGSRTYDRGICHNAPPTGSSPGGFGIKAGMYMHKNQAWNIAESRVIYNANIKVGDENTTFSDMSPDGSSLTSTRPMPPQLASN